nr:uncharacterized protein LOC105842306 isoform X2 [Bombyx mori]
MMLLDFLKEHPDLAKGKVRRHRTKFSPVKLWNLCAKKLNTVRDGAVKDGKGWSRYWCDWKYRAKRRALEIKAAKNNQKPLPEDFTQLSSTEETILSIIGHSCIDDIFIKTDPLAQDNNVDADTENDADNQYQVTPQETLKLHKRYSSKEGSDLDRSGCSSPIQKKRNTSNAHIEDSEVEDEAAEFLRIEVDKLQTVKRIGDSIQTIATEVTKLTEVMGHIRDLLMNNRMSI